MTDITTSARLEYLRGEIEAERISWGEIAELQSLAKYIDPGDTLLLFWAGVPEHDARPDDDPEPGDRCKDCGEDITWIGPSTTSDWMHVDDPRNT